LLCTYYIGGAVEISSGPNLGNEYGKPLPFYTLYCLFSWSLLPIITMIIQAVLHV